MAFTVEISRRTVTYYDGHGEWMDGESTELADHGTSVEAYDEYDAEEYGSPVAWAIDRLRRTDACEPSVSPIPDTLPAHAWLSGTYDEPYTSDVQETTARVTGDFTDAQRAEIFRGVTAR